MPRDKLSHIEEHVGSTPEGWILLAVPNGKPPFNGGLLDDRAFVTKKVATETFNQSGVRGPQGATGVAGQNGPEGSVGPAGDAGATGPAGPAGATGIDGGIPVEVSLNDGIARNYFGDEPLGAITEFVGGQGWGDAGRASGATVVTRSRLGFSTEKRVQLINGQFARKFAWASNWNKLVMSIGLRADAVANFTGNYYFGICSGITNLPLDASTDNFAGLAGAQVGTITWTRTVGTRFNHYVNSAGIMCSRNGVSTTVRSSNGSGLRIAEDEGNTLVFSVIVERSYPSFQYTITDAKCSSTTAEYHSGKQSTQLTSFRSDLPPTGLLADTNTSGNFNMNEIPGVLDSFCFAWDSATPVEVTAVNVVRHF